jgi:hypothetical protein
MASTSWTSTLIRMTTLAPTLHASGHPAGGTKIRFFFFWEIRYPQAPSTTFGSCIITMGAGSGERPQENHYLQYNSGGS